MKKPSKLLQALAAAGVAVGIAAGSGSALADPPAWAHGPGSKFKPPGDTGRPDIFGPPGKPDIGPPGQYEG
ncbi:MAG: hypothetical protein AB7O56_03440 [Bauldia sp.]